MGVVPHRRMWHFSAAQQFFPCSRGSGTHQHFDDWHEDGAVAYAQGVGTELLVRSQIIAPSRAAESLPLPIVADRQHQPTVRGGEQLIRHDLQMSIPLAG